MNYLEFLDALRQTPREWWSLTASGRLRATLPDENTCCPITAVDEQHERPANAWNVGHRLGMSLELREDVIHAADFHYFRERPKLNDIRRDLLTACGLAGATR